MKKYCNKRGSLLEEQETLSLVHLREICYNDFLLEKFIDMISDEVEKICEEFARRGLLDEFSDGTFLDAFITHKYEMIRNELQRQHLRHLYMIQGIFFSFGRRR